MADNEAIASKISVHYGGRCTFVHVIPFLSLRVTCNEFASVSASVNRNPMGLLLLYIANVLEKHFCKCDTYEDHKSYISEKMSESGPIPVAIPVFRFCSYVCLL